MTPRNTRPLAATAAAAALLLAGCGSTDSTPGSSSATTIKLTNCNVETSFPNPANRVFVNDSGMIAMFLAIGAQKQMTAFSSLNRDHTVLARHYGDLLAGRAEVANQMPAMETIIAKNPNLVVAGWNYGFKEGSVTPDALKSKGIDSYLLTESCRQTTGKSTRGIEDPWTALDTDLTNLGTLTGHKARAAALVSDIDTRRKALQSAPQATTKPNILMFDSGDKTVFTSGRYAGPQAVITAAGGRNVMDDVKDTWTTVSWERIAASNPQVIVFNDYGAQTFAQKVKMLQTNSATKNLDAVKNKRFLNLPYAMWVSSPLNIDAAEQLRYKLEQWKLVPTSNLGKPQYDDSIAKSPAS